MDIPELNDDVEGTEDFGMDSAEEEVELDEEYRVLVKQGSKRPASAITEKAVETSGQKKLPVPPVMQLPKKPGKQQSFADYLEADAPVKSQVGTPRKVEITKSKTPGDTRKKDLFRDHSPEVWLWARLHCIGPLIGRFEILSHRP